MIKIIPLVFNLILNKFNNISILYNFNINIYNISVYTT